MGVQIKNSICFVTGSNRGIGRAVVEGMIRAGAAKVYASARNTGSLKDLAASSGGKVVLVTLDVTNEGQVQAAAKMAQDTQILINNAGVANYTSGLSAQDMKGVKLEMDVNYYGVLYMCRAFAPILKKNGGGAIANVVSVGGLIGIPAFGTYCASKAAAHSLTQTLRGELKTQNTLVSGIYPGPIETDMTATIDMEKESPANVAQEIFAGLAAGLEDIFPDKVSKDFARKLKADAKALEREWSSMLPQTTNA